MFVASAALVFSWVLPAAAREPAPFVPNDSFYHLSRAGLESMAVPRAWRVTQGDPRVVIAVVDSGVGRDPDLTPNLLPGFNAIDGGADTTDENGHGSEQAALIGSVLDNGLGTAGICGRCRILPVKVFGADGRADVETIARGIRWASEHGARVINLSFALVPGSAPSASLNDALADAVSRGITVVAGAGNSGSADPAANALAASNPQTIRVASIGTESHRLDGNSNRGSWVDVAASAELSSQGLGLGTHRRHLGCRRSRVGDQRPAPLLQPRTHPGAHQGHPRADVDAVRRRGRLRRGGGRLPGRPLQRLSSAVARQPTWARFRH